MRKVLWFVAAAACAGTFGGSVSAHPSSTLVVDKDGVQCPNAEFVSINAAVAVAGPGDRIKVCPDLYTESVTVDKPLRLEGATTPLGSESCFDPAGNPADDPTQNSIVDGAAFSFSLQADDIDLKGFTVEGATIGIETSDAFSGYRIHENVVQENANFGVNHLSSGGKQSRVDHNCLRLNEVEGHASEVGDLANALVDHNSSFSQGVGIDASGAGLREDVTFSHNRSRSDVLGFLISNSRDSALVHNVVDPSLINNIPILVAGGNVRLDVSHNDLGPALGVRNSGILFSQTGSVPVFPVPNIDIVVSHNEVSGRSTGINLGADSVDGSLFSHNRSHDNAPFEGIRLAAANNGNLFEHNEADRNARDGIRVLAGATGNTFSKNRMLGNVEHDAHDFNWPFNVWTANKCETDFPAGTIC